MDIVFDNAALTLGLSLYLEQCLCQGDMEVPERNGRRSLRYEEAIREGRDSRRILENRSLDPNLTHGPLGVLDLRLQREFVVLVADPEWNGPVHVEGEAARGKPVAFDAVNRLVLRKIEEALETQHCEGVF